MEHILDQIVLIAQQTGPRRQILGGNDLGAMNPGAFASLVGSRRLLLPVDRPALPGGGSSSSGVFIQGAGFYPGSRWQIFQSGHFDFQLIDALLQSGDGVLLLLDDGQQQLDGGSHLLSRDQRAG